jgi:hypothetical protein
MFGASPAIQRPGRSAIRENGAPGEVGKNYKMG